MKDINSIIEHLQKYEDESLRSYQKDYKQEVYNKWKDYRSVMLQMPTGTGKTKVFASILSDVQRYNKEFVGMDNEDENRYLHGLVFVHRKEIVEQIEKELGQKYFIHCGIIQAGDREKDYCQIQVASVQTLSNRLEKWKDKNFDFIIVDEAHHVIADIYKKIINEFPNAKILGVTATPYRLSGVGFRPEMETLITADPISKFIEQGYLSSYKFYSVAEWGKFRHDLHDVKLDKFQEYDVNELSLLCDNVAIRAQVVDTYMQYAANKKGIVYTINTQHNKQLCSEFCNRGITCVALDSKTSPQEREQALKDFRKGEIQVICNVDLFSEGFDCPDIEFIQLARPTKSLSLYLQQVGRGLRKHQEKMDVIILDNVGLYYDFGFPSQRRSWERFFEGTKSQTTIIREKNNAPRKQRKETNTKEGFEELHLLEIQSEEEYEKSRLDFYKNLGEEILHFQNDKLCEALLRQSEGKFNLMYVSYDTDMDDYQILLTLYMQPSKVVSDTDLLKFAVTHLFYVDDVLVTVDTADALKELMIKDFLYNHYYTYQISKTKALVKKVTKEFFMDEFVYLAKKDFCNMGFNKDKVEALQERVYEFFPIYHFIKNNFYGWNVEDNYHKRFKLKVNKKN